MNIRKPVVTYSGDKAVFSNVETGLVSGLPTEAVEWKRSYGRTTRQVYVECDFEELANISSSSSPSSTPSSLQGQPVFHTFWTDVMDLDQYRLKTKDEISNWLSSIRRTWPNTDWMIVLVESPGNKSNKFPLRTTVLDKMKQDVGGKTPERCVSITDPGKSDSKAVDSMQSLLHKFRQMFLLSYNKVLNKFEETVRNQREKRNEPNWNFCQYFLLQEELAFVYQSLGLFDESLIQYDELDALFTQFVLNSSLDDCPQWLEKFKEDLNDWTPLTLNKDENVKVRGKLESLISLRNYLFSQQCSQLIASNKLQEVAARTIPFLHNTAQELEILEIQEVVPGSLHCWILLAVLEVVQTCDHMSGVTQHTASLWSLAREKLLRLGELCGLMPGQSPSSGQLHNVISLTACLPDTDSSQPTPATRLRDSLSSNDAFQRNYLEICEIALSSYKHIGRMRSAKLVGRELSTFYISMGEYAKATTFLVEALKIYQEERWGLLSVKTMLDLAKCYRALEDTERYTRIAAQLSSSGEVSGEEQDKYFTEFSQSLEKLSGDDDKALMMPSQDIINFISCTSNNDDSVTPVSPGQLLSFNLHIISHLPRPVTCDMVRVSLSVSSPSSCKTEEKTTSSQQRKPVSRSASAASNHQQTINLDQETDSSECVEFDDIDQLEMVEHLDYKQDKSLSSARLVCRNPSKVLTRKDSSGSMLRDLAQLEKHDFTQCLETNNIILEPGDNVVQVEARAGPEDGGYVMSQMLVQVKSVEFLYDITEQQCPLFSVGSIAPTLSLDKDVGDLFAGVDTLLTININTGSQHVEPGTRIMIRCEPGLQIRSSRDEEYSNLLELELAGGGQPFQNISNSVFVKSKLHNQKDVSSIERKVRIKHPWSSEEKEILLHFTPAFYTTFHLLTALDKKFLQVFVFPVGHNLFSLRNHNISLSSDSMTMIPINNADDVLETDASCEAGYLWQLVVEDESKSEQGKSIKVNFSVEYKDKKTSKNDAFEYEKYEAAFSFENCLTLYTIQAKIDPIKGNEFCRQNTICPMTIQLEQCNLSPYANLYYEVISDQTVWAVCGRQGAVVTLTQGNRQNIVVEVMPLLSGHLFLPSIRLSKYIPAEDGTTARLDPFSAGEVYNISRSQQVHVLPAANHQEYTPA